MKPTSVLRIFRAATLALVTGWFASGCFDLGDTIVELPMDGGPPSDTAPPAMDVPASMPDLAMGTDATPGMPDTAMGAPDLQMDVVIAMPDAPKAVSFMNDIQPIFTQNCATSDCHIAGSSVPVTMNLQAGQAYASIVKVAAMERSLFRINPGDPTTSYLYLKVTNDPSLTTSPMPPPPTRQPLDMTATNLIKAWILAGALNN